MLTPHLRTRRAVLRPAGAEAAPIVYDYLMRLGMHSLPPLSTFARYFMDEMFALFTIELAGTEEPIGFAALQNHSPARHVEGGIFTEAGKTPRGVGAEATTLLLNYGFAEFDELRKIYFVTTEASREGFGVVFRTVLKEATLPQHMYFQGQLWDAHYYAVSREDWSAGGAKFLDRLVGPATSETGEVGDDGAAGDPV